LDAARLVGVDSPARLPDAGMSKALLAAVDPHDAARWKVMLALAAGDSSSAEAAVSEEMARCQASDDAKTCEGDLIELHAVLAAHGLKVPKSEATICATEGNTPQESLLLGALCGKETPEDSWTSSIEALRSGDRFLNEPAALWYLAAACSVSGRACEDVAEMAASALRQSTVEGLYLDVTPAFGTLMSSWAMLYLTTRSGTDITSDSYEQVVRAAEPDAIGHPDREILLAANLDLIHAKEASPAALAPIELKDPDGPYNPFFALIGRQLSGRANVTFSVPASEYQKTPLRLASAIVTMRLLDDGSIKVTGGQLADLVAAAKDESSPSGLRLLAYAAARLAGAADLARPPIALDCSAVPWMAQASAEDRSCDLRASLMAHIVDEVTT
jgi:hypothetical protein